MLNKYFSLLKKKNSKCGQSLWNVQWLSQLWKRFQQSQVPEENLPVFQEGYRSSVTSAANPHTWATSFLTERNNCKISSLRALKQPVLANSLPQKRKEPVNLLCPNKVKYFTARWHISIAIHSQQLRTQRSSWQHAHVLHFHCGRPITGRIQKQLPRFK